MNSGRTVFAQVMERIPHWEFRRLAERYDPADGRRHMSSWDHFLTLAFAQMTFRRSLRDIEACLQPVGVAHSLGIRARVTRSTLARANEQRSWQLASEVVKKLMARAQKLYAEDPGTLGLPGPVIAVDSTLIDLSLALCPWANWNDSSAAVKLNTALDLRGPIPVVLSLVEGYVADVTFLDQLPITPGAYYILDRGYVDLGRLRRIAESAAFFVIRERQDVRHYVVASRPVDRSGSLRADQSIRFNGPIARKSWPGLMRRVTMYDSEQRMRLEFWTNNWTLPASTITELYRHRWQIETFFRWVKGTLQIDVFFGTTPNAVRIQLWTAVAVYLSIAIVRKELRIDVNLTTLVQILSLHALAKVPIHQLVAKPSTTESTNEDDNQLLINYL